MIPHARLRALLGLLCLTGLFDVAACGRDGASDARSSRVVIALANDVATLDPHKTNTVATDLSVLGHIYPALTTRTPDLKLNPGLAQRWEAVSPTTWRFHLTQNARFANGEPLDAAAVAWNLNRVLNPDTGSRIRPWFQLVSSVDTPDAVTVDIHIREPFPALPAQLSMLFLLPPVWAQSHDPGRETLAGGPYQLVRHITDDRIELARNPGYFGPRPPFDTVEFRVIPSATGRVAALMAGEVDLITNYPGAEVERLKAAGFAQAGVTPGIRTVFLKLNTEIAPLGDRRVRQALNYAIDKTALSRGLFGGQVQPLNGQLLTPAYFGYDPALAPYPYDPARARRLLAEAGVHGDQPIELQVPTDYTPQGEETAQVVADQLRAVGLNVHLRQLEPSYYMDRYVKAHDLGALSLLTYAWPTLDADGLLSLLRSDTPYAYYEDPWLDRALAEARQDVDIARRQDRYHAIARHLREEAPVVFLYVQPLTYAASPRVDWRVRGDDWIRAMDLSPRTAPVGRARS